MGKSKNRRQAKSKPKSKATEQSQEQTRLSLFEIQTLEKAEAQLKSALKPFLQGDFVIARAAFESAQQDETLSDDARQRAAELARATGPERTSMLVGLGCALLLMLVFLTMKLTQP